MSRRPIFGELTELVSFVADQPCENMPDDPTAVTRPGCGSCWICRARILLARIERQAKKKKSPTPRRSRARR